MGANITRAIGDDKVLDRFRDKKDVEGLIKGLHHWDYDLRARAAFYLGELGDPEAVEPLIQAIKNDEKYGIKIPATKALAKIGGERALKIILKQSWGKIYWTRRTAAESLGILGSKQGINTLARLTKDKNGDVRIAAIRSLGKIHDIRAIKPLLRVWKKHHNKTHMNEGHIALDTISNITKASTEAYELVIRSCNDLEKIIAKPTK